MRRRAAAALALALLALAVVTASAQEPPPATPAPPFTPPGPPLPPVEELFTCEEQAIGAHNRGRLENGVLLPAEGDDYFTWDALRDRSPNRSWRRWSTQYLMDAMLQVFAEYMEEEPLAARIGVSDVSRTRGGIFDERYGGLGHSSHQNGLDVDIPYPRKDGLELGISEPSEVDVKRSQRLVNLFVEAGARYVFVGPRLPLRGRRGVVQKLRYHDDHMHVRLECPR